MPVLGEKCMEALKDIRFEAGEDCETAGSTIPDECLDSFPGRSFASWCKFHRPIEFYPALSNETDTLRSGLFECRHKHHGPAFACDVHV